MRLVRWTPQTAANAVATRNPWNADPFFNLVNNFFYEKLSAVPTIKAYMDGISGAGAVPA